MTAFHHIRFVLAREPGHPDGDLNSGYDLVAPLDADFRLDPEACRAHADRCRLRRFEEDDTVAVGRLAPGEDGRWVLDFQDLPGEPAVGVHFGDERFVLGEYLGVADPSGETHTYRVTLVEDVSKDLPL